MSLQNDKIPLYSADGRPLGPRTPEAAQRLIANGHVKPVYGPKRRLKALFLEQEDGANPVEAHPRTGSRYIFQQRLDSGHRTWKHKRLDEKDEDGKLVTMRQEFLRVVRERMR